MADWIKMRSSLLTNPKVIRMARVLLQHPEFMEWLCPGRACDSDERVTKRDVPVVTRIVVGSLVPTWSAVNDTAARDGVIRHATSQDIDESAGVPGFGKALMAVDWLEELPDGEGVRFVNFEEHNSPQKERSLTAKSGAERTKEYRDRKRREAGGVTSRDGDRDDAGDAGVTSQRDDREEKNRGEKNKKEPKGSSSAAKLPPCPFDDIVAIYHEVLPELPRVRLMGEPRKRALQSLWRFVLTSKKPDKTPRATNAQEALGWIRTYFDRARENDFLMGRTPRTGQHANWLCDLDFLLSDKGKTHVIEKTGEAG